MTALRRTGCAALYHALPSSAWRALPWFAMQTSWAHWENCIRRGAKGLLKEVALFDIYTGTGIAPGKKSVAFNLTLRADDRSLTAAEADEDVSSVLALLKSELGATLR